MNFTQLLKKYQIEKLDILIKESPFLRNVLKFCDAFFMIFGIFGEFFVTNVKFLIKFIMIGYHELYFSLNVVLFFIRLPMYNESGKNVF